MSQVNQDSHGQNIKVQTAILSHIPILDGRNLEKEEVLLRSSFLNRAGIKQYIKSTIRWIAESHKSQNAYYIIC